MSRKVMIWDDKLYDHIAEDIGRLPKQFQAEFKVKTRNPVRNLRRRVNRVPARQPAHPFIWSYDNAAQARARNWWFAAIAGRIPGVTIPTSGGRYKRQGFDVLIEFDRPNGTISADIPSSGLGYVVLENQVPSHAKTGWPRVDLELQKAEVQFLDNAIKVWNDITNKVGER